MTERRTGGTRRAEPDPKPIVVRIGSILLPLAILSLVATLVVFGDSIFDGGSEPDRPDQGATASSPVGADGETRTVVAETAATVLDTWSRPGVTYASWWRRLQPMLTPGGQEAYAYTDPAQVPRLADIALDEVVLHPSGSTATVYFSTSEGRFGVDLSRRATDADWLANRVVFPDGESMFA